MLNNEIQFLKNHNVRINGVIHVGAHRGEEVDYYENVFNAKEAILIEPNPEVFKELKFNLDNKNSDKFLGMPKVVGISVTIGVSLILIGLTTYLILKRK